MSSILGLMRIDTYNVAVNYLQDVQQDLTPKEIFNIMIELYKSEAKKSTNMEWNNS